MTKGATILIIDDDPATRELLSAYLENSDFRVIEAQNGRTGLEQCRRYQPDLVLCDLRLPDMSGFEVLESMSHDAPETPVIVISVINQLSEAIKAFKLGASDYITKPIDNLAVLEHSIRQALERAGLVRKNREYQEYLETTNQKLEQSLLQLKEDEEAGRRLQFQLLPRNKKAFGAYYFSRRLWTSLYLSGDFVDYFDIDDEHIGFYMADVSGHGVSSAFVTVLLKSYMNRYLELHRQGKSRGILDPATIFTRMNRNILKSGMNKYLTMFYGVIYKPENKLYYSNGGQFPYPLLFDGNTARYIECKSKPVGLFDFAEYHTEVMELPSRFTMVLASDGILEILPQTNLAEKRSFLLSALEETGFSMEALYERLESNANSTPPDDITLLLIRKRELNR
jgi:serine phosphatase RsbU (regulator of sigma subunit)